MICPKCNGMTEVGDKRCSCGWRTTQKVVQQQRLCEFNDHGHSCGYLGHLSTGTIGTGPWYCRPHFARVMGWQPWEAALNNETQTTIDRRVQDIVPKDLTESQEAWTKRCKAFTLTLIKKRLEAQMRQPGED